MLDPNLPALVLAPMDGITDAPMRALQSATGAFTFTVSEFVRVSNEVLPKRVFLRDVPELKTGGVTPSGVPVQVQILGGDPERMAKSALAAVRAGALGIDINFGCPAPTVNRHDGGASLLKFPERIRDIVEAVRAAVPEDLPVSAKLRLGWDSVDSIYENAAKAVEGGASWITIHARTRAQGYLPPVYWKPIGQVRASVKVPVVANGDIWTLDDFRRCRDETGCIHFMVGRGVLANPGLSTEIAEELGIRSKAERAETDWLILLPQFLGYMEMYLGRVPAHSVMRLKQWLKLASNFGEFRFFDEVKFSQTSEELLEKLSSILRKGEFRETA